MTKPITVLLADDYQNFSEDLSRYLETQPDIKVVGKAYDGMDTYDKISSLNPDVVVMDMFMPQMDGLSVLKKLKNSGNSKKPVCIVTSVSGAGNIMNNAISAGAAYYVLKPIKEYNLFTDIIRDFALKSPENENISVNSSVIGAAKKKDYDLETIVTDFIHELGIPAHIKGYQYIRTAIMMSVENMEVINFITKLLYPTIAKQYSTTSSRVERAIRHSIEVAWNRGRPETMNEIFGYTIHTGRGKPTNSEFIAMVADRIRLQIK